MRIQTWLFYILAIAMSFVSTVDPILAMIVKGDKAAWSEVVAAYKKLNSLSGYRMKMTMLNGMQMTVDMVPLNTMHIINQLPGGRGSMEIVRIGSRSASRMDIPGMSSKWQCDPQAVAPTLPPDPTSLQGTVDISRGSDTQIAGTPVHTYTYTVMDTGAIQSRLVKTTLSVNAQTGFPLKSVTVTRGKFTMTTDYCDYGAKFVITLPADCG